MGYFYNLLVAIDQFANVLLAGWPDETLSARAYRMEQKGHRYWGWTAKAINAMFFWQANHCRGAWRDEMERRQLPPEFRNHTPGTYYPPGSDPSND